MTGNARPVIVVGVTGSPASAAALRWAADEACRRSAWLRVVRVWSLEPRASYAAPVSTPDRRQRQEHEQHDLAATMNALFGPVLPGSVIADVREGMAERVLVDASAGADLLVLGSASGRFAGRSAGPVIRTCLSRAHCPLVVVSAETVHESRAARRERPDTTPAKPDARRDLAPVAAPARETMLAATVVQAGSAT
ncbi:MAG TPA: universal stress protein [Streptosporangiaceae bacterium]|nr:universal stress protein [Streptosporangiaceae bacterium]